MRVCFTSLGCKLNLAEVERWQRDFRLAGHALVASLEEADLHVINTCSVTAEAARFSRQVARRGRRVNAALRTVVTGCYAASSPAEAVALLGVDLVVGNGEKGELLARVEETFGLERGDNLPYLAPESGHARATVKIGDGCNMACAFCIIPRTRGREQSRPRAEIIAEVGALVASGFREVVLTGVQISDYHDGEASLYELTAELLEQTATERLRLTSIAPWRFDRRLLGLFADRRLCRHVHLSLQSGSTSTLKRMRRPYTAAAYAALKARFEEAVPGIAITTDVIAGFPGETVAEFEESLAFVAEQGFAKIHAFPFSPRPGTAAATMPDQVPGPIKRERMARLGDVAAATSRAFAERHLGQVVEVLWETREDGLWQGLTDNYLRVFAPLEGERRNTLSKVEVVEVREGGVVGRQQDADFRQ